MRTLRPLVPRAAARLVAVLLAAIVCAGSIHASWDDLACDPAPAHHDHNAHRLRAGTLPAGTQDHCLFCHSLRSLRNGLIAVHTVVASSTRTTAVRSSSNSFASSPLESSAASRAPPAVLL